MKNFFVDLEQSMRKHRFLAQNPVLKMVERGQASKQSLTFTVEQYSMLPAWIVRLLSACRGRLKGWPGVQTELSNNIGEEAGSKTGGLSHVEILFRRLQKELGANVRHVTYSKDTQEFLDAMLGAIQDRSPAFATGVAYALEDSATPELLVVGKILNAFARVANIHRPIREETLNSQSRKIEVTNMEEAERLTLDDFLGLHIEEFEPGHRNRLADALTPVLKQDPKLCEELRQGFEYTLSLMDVWWDSMVKHKARHIR